MKKIIIEGIEINSIIDALFVAEGAAADMLIAAKNSEQYQIAEKILETAMDYLKKSLLSEKVK